MICLNFAHPLTQEQIINIEEIAGKKLDRVVDIPCKFDLQREISPQITKLAERCQLTPTDWQTLPIIINLPSLNIATAVLLAELNGRMGYLPSIIRIRPVERNNISIFRVAEIINLQSLQQQARLKRNS